MIWNKNPITFGDKITKAKKSELKSVEKSVWKFRYISFIRFETFPQHRSQSQSARAFVVEEKERWMSKILAGLLNLPKVEYTCGMCLRQFFALEKRFYRVIF